MPRRSLRHCTWAQVRRRRWRRAPTPSQSSGLPKSRRSPQQAATPVHNPSPTTSHLLARRPPKGRGQRLGRRQTHHSPANVPWPRSVHYMPRLSDDVLAAEKFYEEANFYEESLGAGSHSLSVGWCLHSAAATAAAQPVLVGDILNVRVRAV